MSSRSLAIVSALAALGALVACERSPSAVPAVVSLSPDSLSLIAGLPNRGLTVLSVADSAGRLVDINAVRGTVTAAVVLDIPAGYAGTWSIALGNVSCGGDFAATDQPVRPSCTFDTRRFANGPYEIAFRLASGTGTVLASSTQRVTIRN